MTKRPAKPARPSARIGRPPRSGEPTVRQVGIRLTAAEDASYSRAAKRAGLTLAEWVRTVCAAAVKHRGRS